MKREEYRDFIYLEKNALVNKDFVKADQYMQLPFEERMRKLFLKSNLLNAEDRAYYGVKNANKKL